MKYVAMLFLVFVAVWCGCPAEEGRYFADGDGVWRVVGPTHVHDWEVGPWRNFTNATELIQGAIDAAFKIFSTGNGYGIRRNRFCLCC